MAATMQSAVRLPTPDAGNDSGSRERNEFSSRKRGSTSRSPSPRREAPPLRRRDYSRSPPPKTSLPRDVDHSRAKERARQLGIRQRDEEAASAKPLTAAEKQASAKAEYDRLLTMRSGGTYIPPARLKALQDQITDKTSKEFQRMAWEALKKSINGLINKVNVSNIKHIVPELFNENLVRGRGLFCRSIMKAQAASLPFTPIYAAMAAIVNTKLPQVGELLINRLIMQFKKAYKRKDKNVCQSSTTFMAHLVNQQVVHELLAAEILLILLNKPTDDSVEIAVSLMKGVGQHLDEMNPKIANVIFDQFRSILHEADIDKRTQYMIEVLFAVRKDKYKNDQAIKEELDLVEEEDQITHRSSLNEGDLNVEDGLNIFKFDPDYEAHEEAYRKLKAEILGEESGSDEDEEDASDESSEEDEEDAAEKALEIKDQSNTDLVNLRRSIYLTIMSSGGFEEACHKLMRINLPSGREEELPSMIIECCSQERTYNKFFGLIGERFCKLNRLWQDLFQEMFCKYYDTIHRYETNRLRIIAQFFGHLLASDAIGWQVFNVVHVNEEETTSSSRIFIKILFEDLASGVGMPGLRDRLRDDALQPALTGLFPTDNPTNTRFSINFFTAIGMGMLTEGMREWLANRPKPAPAPLPEIRSASRGRSRSSSVSSYTTSYFSGSSRSRSRSVTPPKRSSGRGNLRNKARAQSHSRSRSGVRRERSPSYDSRSPPRRSYRSLSRDSRSPPPRKARSPSYDTRSPSPRRPRSPSYDSRSPPPRRRRQMSDSRSPVSARGRRRSYTDDSPSPPRRRLDSTSRTPPRRVNGSRRSLSRDSPARVPRRSSRSPPPAGKRARSASSYDSRSRSRARRSKSPVAKRNRRSSSPEPYRAKQSASRNAPVRNATPSHNGDASSAVPIENNEGGGDMSHIHPSRRGLMASGGGPKRRAQASDFM